MNNLSSSIFYILTGWTCAINIYKFFYQKKLKEFSKNGDHQNDSQFNEMSLHFKKADKLGKIFLILWCISALWFTYNINEY
tara:strand:+ start:2049 stop:2291 length:243 start_codon:yes stop_codon:yes gene_type:complete